MIAVGTCMLVAVCLWVTRSIGAYLGTTSIARKALIHAAAGGDTIVIPVLDCPSLACAAFEHFRQLGRPVFVGSARDHLGTVEALRTAGAHVIVAPSRHVGRAAQVKWALESLPHTEWVSIYDVDSRPSAHSLRYFASGQPSDSVDVIARLSTYETGLGRGFFDGLALRQAWWSLTFERSMWSRRRFWYLVGHGVSVKWSTLARYLDVTCIVDDLALGYDLSSSGHVVRIGVDRDVALAADTAHQLINQAARWFIGEWEGTRRLPVAVRWVRRAEVFATWGGAWIVLAAAYVMAPAVAHAVAAIGITYGAIAYTLLCSSDRNRRDPARFLGFMSRGVVMGAAVGVATSRRALRLRNGFDPTRYREVRYWCDRHHRISCPRIPIQSPMIPIQSPMTGAVDADWSSEPSEKPSRREYVDAGIHGRRRD